MKNAAQRRILSSLWIAALLLAGAFVYAPAFHGAWIWDDIISIRNNPLLRDGAGLKKIWIEADTPDYFPLTSTAQWLEWHAWGAGPLGYHLINVGLHVLSGVLFAFLLGRLSRAMRTEREATGAPWWNEPWWAWLGGLLFVVHPVAVESVAWISELKNALSLPPLLLACLAYLDFDERGRKRDGARALLWFLAALLCKTSVIMLPAAVTLYAWWRRGRVGRRDLIGIAGLLAIAIPLGIVTIVFQRHRAIGGWSLQIGGWPSRFAAAGRSLAFYAGKALRPFPLMPIYPRWDVAAPGASAALPWLGLGALAALFWRKRAGWGRHALLGLGWSALSLVPVLGFVPMAYLRMSWVADHFAYLALLGPIGLAAAGFGWWQARPGFGWTAGAALALVLGLAAESRRYAANFQGELPLWSYAVRLNPQAWSAQNNLGEILLHEGKPSEAAEHFQAALRLQPDAAEAENNLGLALQAEGRRPEAIAAYRQAIRMEPDFADADNNLGNALQIDGRMAEAIDRYRDALRIDPDKAETHNNLGNALLRMGYFQEALGQYALAVRLKPESPEARNNFANLLARLGALSEAAEQYAAAVRLRPDDAGVQARRGTVLLRLGRLNEAEQAYAAAEGLGLDDADIHYNFALALLQQRRWPEAAKECAEALRLRPSWAEAHTNLGNALGAEGRKAAAEREYEEALRLNPDLLQARENLAGLRAQASGGAR